MEYIPTVRPRALEEFKKLYEKRCRACLLPIKTEEGAQRVLMFYYIKHVLPLVQQENKRAECRYKSKLKKQKREVMRKQTPMIST